MIKETFNIAPVPASRPRVTRYGTYFPKKYTLFRKQFDELLGDNDKYNLCHTVRNDGLLSVKLDFYVQIPKSWSKKKTKEMEGKYCSNNADLDNYCKAALDGLEGRYYENDKQVVLIRARKFYSKDARIEFEISPIEEAHE
jgi:Holliday junction resolvase RusA-like endonuclease